MEFLLVREKKETYKEAEIEANKNVVGDRNGSEFDITQVTGEGLGDNIHGERREAAEYRGPHNEP